MKKNKKTVGIIIAVVALIIGIICATDIFNPYEKQIKLGYKMLGEERYEEAILAFEDAIEIDTKKDKAYIGLADTYVTRCDENVIYDINDALSRGYETTESSNIINSYIDASDKLFNNDQKDNAVELLELGYETTEDDSIKSKLDDFKLIIRNEFLQSIYELCRNEELDEVRTIIDSVEFWNFVSEVSEGSPMIYFDENSESNIGLGVYSSDDVYVYFGEYADNVRSGNGIWLNAYYLYRGEWSGDKPNGTGISYEGPNESNGCRIQGSIIEGFWNGTIIHDDVHDGEERLYQIVEYNNGIVIAVSDEYGPWDDWQEDYDGNPHGILGFAEKGWF